MSDNVSKIHFPQPKKLIWRILLFLGIALFVLAVVAIIVLRDRINLDAAQRWLKYLNVSDASEAGTFSYDAHTSNRYANVSDGLVVASSAGVSVFSDSGKLLCEHQMPMKTPTLQTQGKSVLCYDAAGNCLCCLNAAGEVGLELECPQPILDADVAFDGACCYSTFETGYKSVLYVYNPEGTLSYRWLSSSHYLPICTVSNDAKYLAAVEMTEKDGKYQSSALVFDTRKEEPIAEFSVGNDLVFDLELLSDNSILVIAESGIGYYQLNGSLIGNYPYEDASLIDFDNGGSGFLTLMMNMNKEGNHNTIITLSKNGAKLGSHTFEEEILDFSVCGRYICVLTASGLYIYDSSMSLYAEKEDFGLSSGAVQRSDGTVIVLTSDQGSILMP